MIGRRIALWGAAWVVGFGFLRLTLMAPEVCPTLTLPEDRASAQAATDWIVENQSADGLFLYHYDRRSDEVVPGYNFVRHAGTVMSLYQAEAAGLDGALDAADSGAAVLLSRTVTTGPDAMAISSGGDTVKLGTAGILAIALLERREITGDTGFDEDIRRLGRFMVGQQRDDGSMLNFWSPTTGEPVPDLTSKFAAGEAMWALARMHNLWPDEGWDEPALATLTHLATDRDREEDLWPPPWPDQWAGLAFGAMAGWDSLTDVHIDYAERLAERFGQMIRWDAQREGTIPELVHLPAPRGGGYATILEGLGGLRALSLADPRFADSTEPIEERLSCGAARLVDRQEVSDDPQVDGAWFYDGQTRVDDQQHALSGILAAQVVLVP